MQVIGSRDAREGRSGQRDAGEGGCRNGGKSHSQPGSMSAVEWMSPVFAVVLWSTRGEEEEGCSGKEGEEEQQVEGTKGREQRRRLVSSRSVCFCL